MHKTTIMLGALFLLLLACGILFLAGGTLSATVSVASASAADHPEAYARVQEIVASGAAPQVFSEPLPEPSACRLEDVTVTLRNPGLISAEWLSVTVECAPGDAVVYSVGGEGGSAPGRGEGSVNLKIAARSDSAGDRAYIVEYYVFGMKRRVTARLSESEPSAP